MKQSTRVSSTQSCGLASVTLIFLIAFSVNAQTKRVVPDQKARGAQPAPSSAVLNLSDFGAVGDGVADEGPAFQSALDALAEAGGGTLFVPSGSYRIETPVIKDFSALNGGSVIIQGVPSDTPPAPPFAGGHELSESLDLTSEIFPATGSTQSVFTISNLKSLTVQHLAFTGYESVITDAYITLFMSDIEQATIFHTEFYGISTFGLVAGMGGGNLIRAVRTDLNINQLMVLGSTANSGAYAPIIENIEWKGFHISNSIFIDFGTRSFFGKMGLGAPLSWVNFASVADRTQESSRREVVIRDTFFDEGGWVGITAYPHLWGTPADPIDLIYISGIKINVSNLGTAGHQFFDVANVLVEKSLYGWSHNTGAALDFYRTDHAILDKLTCIMEADRIRADDRTQRLTVINSEFGGLDSLAQTTTVLETAPADDPVQFVRNEFLSLLGREPDPAAHFYWSDLLIRCGGNEACLVAQKAEMEEYLQNGPQREFAFGGTVLDENGAPLRNVKLNLSGSQFATGATDDQGRFKFVGLPTSGIYTVTVSTRHHTFTTATSQTFERPSHDVNVTFRGRLHRHKIAGRIAKFDNTGIAGVTVTLVGPSTITAITDAEGNYSFPDLAAGENYSLTPELNDIIFVPANFALSELSSDRAVNFGGRLRPEVLTAEQQPDIALVLDSVSFVVDPISIISPLNFGDGGRTRLMLFVTNLEGITNPSQLTVTATDDNNLVYPFPVEFVGNLPEVPGLKQVNLRVWPSFPGGRCVTLRLVADNIHSTNTPRFCFAP